MKNKLKLLIAALSVLFFVSCENEKDYYDSISMSSFLTGEQVIEVDPDAQSFTLECKWSDGFTHSATVSRGLPISFDAENSTAIPNVHFVYKDDMEFSPTASSTLIGVVEILPENITQEVVLYYDLNNSHIEAYPYPIIERQKVTLKPLR